jgi:uncharacterized protein
VQHPLFRGGISVIEAEQAKPGVPPSVRVHVKVVPGAKREQIAGLLGDRLKVRVAQPPEGGKANKAVCALIADALGIKASAVSVIAGASSPEKVLRVEGIGVEAARAALAAHS